MKQHGDVIDCGLELGTALYSLDRISVVLLLKPESGSAVTKIGNHQTYSDKLATPEATREEVLTFASS